jgi:hypothetical protein
MQAGSKLLLLIATPVVLLMHLLVFLGCQWSISCRCTVGYKQCSDIDSAELVRVYPAPNCGLEELVLLQVYCFNTSALLLEALSSALQRLMCMYHQFADEYYYMPFLALQQQKRATASAVTLAGQPFR